MSLGENRLPDFLVIGAMRSGTSSLAHYLRAHPEVCLATTKEVHFFDRNFERGIDWYRQHFPCTHAGHVTGEATQTYMYDGKALERMATVVPEARLIAILRNPADRAYSHYWLNRARHREPLDFAAAIEAESDRLDGSSLDGSFYSYLDRGRYAKQLRRVCEHYPRDRLLVVLFDDLQDSPASTYRSISRFLQLDDGFLPPDLGRVVNPYVTFRSVKVREAAKRLPRPLRRLVGRLNTRRASYPPMNAAIRTELLQRLEDDTKELEAWLERDLSRWKA